MSLLQDVLKYNSEARVSGTEGRYLAANPDANDDDDIWINVTSAPGSPFPTRPPSPSRAPISLRQPRGGLQSTSRRDPLRLFPTEVCQRVFVFLSLSDLAKLPGLNYLFVVLIRITPLVWFQHYRREHFVDTSLPPGKWTKRESKQNWRAIHLKSISERTPPVFSRTSGTQSANRSGYQTPREIKEEQWRLAAEGGTKPGKQEMREIYKELGGRKAKTKLKLGSSGMRQLVSYADIAPPAKVSASMAKGTDGHVSKKPKIRNSGDTAVPNAEMLPGEPRAEHTVASEESRELTHEEIWDDSALIDAWNAATEEYEALNGPDKSWKSGPVHKAPLWYNVPPDSKTKQSSSLSTVSVPSASDDDVVDDKGAEEDSKPLDFDTYIPTYNPNFESFPQSVGSINTPSGISQDEAFSHAMNAMYWTGYWTAIYHCRREDHARGDIEGDGLESDLDV
ncbi:hypothetical protein APHAL10511_006587 [Amanita phalloides]|nr:hypothetical protein APHAL10511_006587 [Amanita phalloides]